MARTRAVLMLAFAFAFATVACGSDTPAPGGGPAVTEKDFSIAVAPSSATAGDVTFTITNDGPSTHEFLVVRSDQDPGSLTVESGEVPEDTLDIVDELEDVAPGTAPTLTVGLEAGSYILMCNLSGHYEQGMFTGFTVS